MPEPTTGVEHKETPAPSQPQGQSAATTPPATGGASAKPTDTGHKTVPITALHEERDKRQAAESRYSELQAEIASLKEMVGQYQPQQQQQQQVDPFSQNGQFGQPFGQQAYNPAYQAAPQNIREQIDALYEQDVRKGFQAEMMAMMQYRDQITAKVDNEVEAVRAKAPDFSNYEGRVRSYIRSLPLEAQSQPNIVQAAYFMMRGQDADNIVKQREAELMKKYQGANAGAGLNGTFSPPQGEGSQLTQEELTAAQALGMTPEEYLKNK